MSLIGLLGLGFAPSGGGGGADYPATTNVRSGITYNFGASVGNLALPAESNVRYGIFYGANSTEYQGQLVVPNLAPIPSNQATQGVDPNALIGYLNTYLMKITGFTQRNIVLWCFPSRPSIEGRDEYLWYAPDNEDYDKSEGPVRFGNKYNLKFTVSLCTRTMRDGSQRDTFRLPQHYITRWKLLNSFQNLNLFDSYGEAPTTGQWYPPRPYTTSRPVSVEPMYLDPTPQAKKDQFEEGSITTTFTVVVPAVLALSI